MNLLENKVFGKKNGTSQVGAPLKTQKAQSLLLFIISANNINFFSTDSVRDTSFVRQCV